MTYDERGDLSVLEQVLLFFIYFLFNVQRQVSSTINKWHIDNRTNMLKVIQGKMTPPLTWYHKIKKSIQSWQYNALQCKHKSVMY